MTDMAKTDGDLGGVLREIASGTAGPVIDVFGPTLEFLTPLDGDPYGFCVLRGSVPSGVMVPLHSHDDAEDFLVLAGTHEVLTPGASGLEWTAVQAGDYVRVPGGRCTRTATSPTVRLST